VPEASKVPVVPGNWPKGGISRPNRNRDHALACPRDVVHSARVRRACLILVWLLAGCPAEPGATRDAGPPTRDAGPAPVAASRPDWTDAPPSREAKILRATGKVSGIRNPALARASADNRARAAIAREYDRFVALVAAEVKGTNPIDPKAFVANVTTGVQIVDHYRDADSHTVYARAELDLGPFFEAMKTEPSLTPEQREAFVAAAERAWARVD
jgi:hypothetical protein